MPSHTMKLIITQRMDKTFAKARWCDGGYRQDIPQNACTGRMLSTLQNRRARSTYGPYYGQGVWRSARTKGDENSSLNTKNGPLLKRRLGARLWALYVTLDELECGLVCESRFEVAKDVYRPVSRAGTFRYPGWGELKRQYLLEEAPSL
jgi:hypothetical protein